MSDVRRVPPIPKGSRFKVGDFAMSKSYEHEPWRVVKVSDDGETIWGAPCGQGSCAFGPEDRRVTRCSAIGGRVKGACGIGCIARFMRIVPCGKK